MGMTVKRNLCAELAGAFHKIVKPVVYPVSVTVGKQYSRALKNNKLLKGYIAAEIAVAPDRIELLLRKNLFHTPYIRQHIS